MQKKSKKKNKFWFVLLFVLLLPLILIELIFKAIVNLFKRRKNKTFGDKEFYDSLSIEKVDIMDGVEFERFLKRLFIYKGFSVSETARTGDFGADLILKKDGRSYVVQAKRYNNNVGAKALQEIYSARAHYKTDFMIVVTNAHFTRQAQVMAEEQNIELIDREELIGIIAEIKETLKEDMTKELLNQIEAESECRLEDNYKYRI